MLVGFRPLFRRISLIRPPLLHLHHSRSNFSNRTLSPKSVANMATSAPARTQPPWKAPESSLPAKLKVYNSLTRSKNDFVPKGKS
jgi:cysteinyl-tRNA synthetase